MFEKDAEEYARKNTSYYGTDDCYDTDTEKVEQVFKDAAEFGYNKAKVEVEEDYKETICNLEMNLNSVTERLEEHNKANEWHKQEVDDIYDLISEDWSVRHFICIMKDKSLVTAIGNCDEGCNGEVGVNFFFDHNDEQYYLDDIVWWKEIVLPELKERE